MAEPLSFDVVAGKLVGPFRLGMPLPVAIQWLTANSHAVRTVDLKYGDERPLDHDIVMDLVEQGVQLRFCPYSQRLKLIDVFDVTRVRLRYAGREFAGPRAKPTFVAVYGLLGPTHPGDYDAAQQRYLLHYPGLTLWFPIPAKHEALYARRGTELPLEFPDGTTPVATRLAVYGGTLEHPAPPALPRGDSTFEEVRADARRGLVFMSSGARVLLGDSNQDVIANLGSPDKVYYKEVDKMRIHGTTEGAEGEAGRVGIAAAPLSARGGLAPHTDYYYNYFERGIDVLFDGKSDTVRSFVLHTNFPGHCDFDHYRRCNFRLVGVDRDWVEPPSWPPARGTDPAKDDDDDDESEDEVHYNAQGASIHQCLDWLAGISQSALDAEDSGGKSVSHALPASLATSGGSAGNHRRRHWRMGTARRSYDRLPAVVVPWARWPDVERAVGCATDRPVVHNRSRVSNPFGSTLFYGYDHAVFEVIRNSHLASVTIFKPTS